MPEPTIFRVLRGQASRTWSTAPVLVQRHPDCSVRCAGNALALDVVAVKTSTWGDVCGNYVHKSSNGNVRMFTWGCEWIIYTAMDLQCVIPNEGGNFWLCRTRKVPVISDVRGPAQICKPARASHPKARPCWAVVEDQESPTWAQAHYAWSLEPWPEPQLLRLPVFWLPAFGLKLYNSTCLYYMTLNLFGVSDGFEWDQILLDANNYEDLDWRHYTDIWQSSLKINVEVGIII